MPATAYIFIIVISSLLGALCQATEKTDAALLSNVSYASVIALDVGSPDKRISYGKDPLQFGELWLPPKTKKNSPLVIFIHGGCWLNAFDIRHADAMNTALTKEGYAVWSIEYRRTGDTGGGWPGSYEDIVAGIKFVKHLGEHSIDLKNVILSGHSAGGHLALLASADKSIANQVRGVVGLAAISDLSTYSVGENSCQKATAKFMGGSVATHESAFLRADPRQHKLHNGVVLIHGDKDVIVPLAQSTESTLPVEVVREAGHFDLIHPGTKAWKIFLKTLHTLTNT